MQVIKGDLSKIQHRKERIVTHTRYGVRKDDEYIYLLTLNDKTVELKVDNSKLRFQKGDSMIIAAFKTREGLKSYAFKNLTQNSSAYKLYVYTDAVLGFILSALLVSLLTTALSQEKLDLFFSFLFILLLAFWAYSCLKEVIRTLRAYRAVQKLEQEDLPN